MIKRFLSCAVVLFLSHVANSIAATPENPAPATSTAVPETPAPSGSQSVRALDDKYVAAFNAEDADAVANTFSKDAVYITDDGRTLKGREEIKDALEQQFKDMDGATLELKVYDIDYTPDKKGATERGVSIVTTKDGIAEPSSYIVHFVKQDDGWYMSRVVETAEAESTEHLKDLEWMVGAWTDQSEDATIRFKVEWSLDRGFLVRRFAVSGMGVRNLTGIEYIGWDPVKKEIHSWYFDSAGGYGGGRWRREGNSWMVDATGITPKGETATGTHIFTPKDAKSFSWRSINRCTGGEKQEDVPEIVVIRTTNAELEAERGQL